MDYFELFELPVSLKPDPVALSGRFFALSRKYHPDYHANASLEDQAGALEKSAQLNQAYRIFQNPDETIKYVLKLKGLLEEEEKYALSPEFLMEVMDLNEALMDAGEPEALRKQIAALEEEIYSPVRSIIEGYQEGVTTTAELMEVKEYYYRKKYLDRMKEQLTGMT
ncbi:MAG: Fe-S protein assembly co-chaperone HscB [Chitinophagales bacterium]|nr:Fe-S protein assembly co-chaperone HscB [Chitinophagales bacterium]